MKRTYYAFTTLDDASARPLETLAWDLLGGPFDSRAEAQSVRPRCTPGTINPLAKRRASNFSVFSKSEVIRTPHLRKALKFALAYTVEEIEEGQE